MFWGKQMLDQKWAEENHDINGANLNNSAWRIDAIDEEIRALDETKASLLEIEKTLWFKIDEEVKCKKDKRKELEAEVIGLKQRCDELLYFVNAFRRE
jgi:hypothetical protein